MVKVLVPTINMQKATKYGLLMKQRAETDCEVILLEDIDKSGWVATLNAAVRQFPSRYYVYAADDAYPSRGWLKGALNDMKSTGAGLVGFNEGKYQELNAGFGLVDYDWVKDIYGGDLLYSGYHSHFSEPELTMIARANDKFYYNPRNCLIEVVFNKDGPNPANNNKKDHDLFWERAANGFDGHTRDMIRSLI